MFNVDESRMKRAIIYTLLSLFFAAIIGMVLLICAYALPIQKVRTNAKRSAVTLLYESNVSACWHNQFNVVFNRVSYAPTLEKYGFRNYLTGCHLDNFSDALIINNASFLGRGNIVYDAMTNPRLQYRETQAMSLYRALQADTLVGASIIDYPRYWHGYLTVIKPLLVFIDLQGIRILNIICQLVLLLLILYHLSKRLGSDYAAAFFCSVLYLNPVSVGLSLQYATVYNIMLMSIWYLVNVKKIKLWETFLWIGIATAYFDFFTAPLVTLGFPLLIVICLEQQDIKMHFKNIIKASLAWSVGYFGFWFEKWLIATIFTSENVIKNGWMVALERMMKKSTAEANVENWTPWAAFGHNLGWFKTDSSVLILIIYLLVMCVYCLNYRCQLKNDKRVLPLLAVGLMPFIWYSVIINHSIVHSFMSYRLLAVSVFAIFSTLCVVLKPVTKKTFS